MVRKMGEKRLALERISRLDCDEAGETTKNLSLIATPAAKRGKKNTQKKGEKKLHNYSLERRRNLQGEEQSIDCRRLTVSKNGGGKKAPIQRRESAPRKREKQKR